MSYARNKQCNYVHMLVYINVYMPSTSSFSFTLFQLRHPKLYS